MTTKQETTTKIYKVIIDYINKHEEEIIKDFVYYRKRKSESTNAKGDPFSDKTIDSYKYNRDFMIILLNYLYHRVITVATRKYNGIAQSQIAVQTKLSKPTVNAFLDILIKYETITRVGGYMPNKYSYEYLIDNIEYNPNKIDYELITTWGRKAINKPTKTDTKTDKPKPQLLDIDTTFIGFNDIAIQTVKDNIAEFTKQYELANTKLTEFNEKYGKGTNRNQKKTYKKLFKTVVSFSSKIRNEEAYLYAIENGIYNFEMYMTNYRIGSVFTRCRKEHRSNILINNNKVTTIDLVASHPTITAHILRDSEEYSDYDDVKLFINHCFNQDQDIYYTIGKCISKSGEDRKAIRKRGKGLWMWVAYEPEQFEYFDENYEDYNIKPKHIKIFRNYFPNVFKYLEETKLDDDNNYAVKLQRLEARKIINPLSKLLTENGIDNITVSDEFIIEEIKLNDALTIINKYFDDYNLKFKLDYDDEILNNTKQENDEMVEESNRDTITEPEIISNTNIPVNIEVVQTEPETIDRSEQMIEDKLTEQEYDKKLDNDIYKWFGYKFCIRNDFKNAKKNIYKSCYTDYLNGIDYDMDSLVDKINTFLK